jgi:hypothetical protein
MTSVRSSTVHESSRPGAVGGFAVLRVVLISLLLLVPCLWQSRIQAGDLSSHVYNAWLASQISDGTLHGVWVARQWNNVLFDLELSFFALHFGFGMAQRIAVGLAVLIFTWGAIRFVSSEGKNSWFVVPSIAMLAYGFTFHLGFFNFYLSLGICLWYLAVFVSAGWGARFLFAPLLALAWLAHPLPVVWAAGLGVYAAIFEQSPPRKRNLLPIAGVAILLAAHFVLMHRYQSFWSIGQAVFVTGANQVLLFDNKYVIVYALLLTLWLIFLRRLLKSRTRRAILSDLHTQFFLLTAAAVILIPTAVTFPQYALPFSYITTRLSLMAGVTFCGLLAGVQLNRYEKLALTLTATVFFAFIFHDTHEFNRIEDQIDKAVAQFPSESRVIGRFLTQSTRINPLGHAVDRACIEHCFSYANYEPASRQFRIRAEAANRAVMNNFADVAQVEQGKYKVQTRDLPLFFVYSCGPVHREVCSRELHAGDDIGVVSREP